MMPYQTGCCVNIWIIVFVLKQAELLSTANNGDVIVSLRLRSVFFSTQHAIKAGSGHCTLHNLDNASF